METDFSLLRGNLDRMVRSMKGWEEYKEVLDTIFFFLEFRLSVGNKLTEKCVKLDLNVRKCERFRENN